MPVGNPLLRLLTIGVCTISLFCISSCSSSRNENTPEYLSSIEHWQQLRIDSLKGKTGYLNLAGLWWLEQGANSIGSDPGNRFVFPQKAASSLGNVYLEGDSVWLLNKSPEVIVSSGLEEDSILIYTPELERITMRQGDLAWYIISRGSEYGIRLKDYTHPQIDSFKGIENYPIDISWRVEAKFEVYAEPKTVIIKNQVGMDLETTVYGRFLFEIDGDQYSLEPTSPLDSSTYFTMIYDQTSGDETYGSGRYIDVPRPDENGFTYIDFNKAYNPPCTWTEFATCTFPHAANRLPIRIEAGEKYAGDH